MMMRELKDIGRVYGDLKAIASSGFRPDHPLWHKYHTPPGQAELDALPEPDRQRAEARLDELQAEYKACHAKMGQNIQNLMDSIDTYMDGHKQAVRMTLSDVLSEGGSANGVR